MWVYQKTLQHPVNIKNMDLKMAKYLITQFGGPNGELAASLRYLSQRYTMPTGKTRALLTDIGTEELAHVEICLLYTSTSSIIYYKYHFCNSFVAFCRLFLFYINSIQN